MLKVNAKVADGIVRIGLVGEIDGSEPCRRIHETIRSNLESGHRRFVMNLGGVDWINSLGAGFLVAAAVSAAREDGVVRLAALRPRVDSVLRACGVVPHVWQSFETDEEALASF